MTWTVMLISFFFTFIPFFPLSLPPFFPPSSPPFLLSFSFWLFISFFSVLTVISVFYTELNFWVSLVSYILILTTLFNNLYINYVFLGHIKIIGLSFPIFRIKLFSMLQLNDIFKFLNPHLNFSLHHIKYLFSRFTSFTVVFFGIYLHLDRV